MTHVSSLSLVDAATGAIGGGDPHDNAHEFRRQRASRARRDDDDEPPADALRAACAFLATTTVARPETATLVFDSFLEGHAVPGVRAGVFTSRHLLYQLRQLSVDLRIEFTGPERILLSGQIVDTRPPTRGVNHALVNLLWDEREIAVLEANDFGEFECEFDLKAGMALSISIPEQAPILIPVDLLPASAHPIWNPRSKIGG